MSNDQLFDYAASVRTRREFIRFIEYLNTDKREHPENWQNNDLDGFLEGLLGFANDMSGFYENMGENVDVETITWRLAAQMLLAATVYGS